MIVGCCASVVRCHFAAPWHGDILRAPDDVLALYFYDVFIQIFAVRDPDGGPLRWASSGRCHRRHGSLPKRPAGEQSALGGDLFDTQAGNGLDVLLFDRSGHRAVRRASAAEGRAACAASLDDWKLCRVKRTQVGVDHVP